MEAGKSTVASALAIDVEDLVVLPLEAYRKSAVAVPVDDAGRPNWAHREASTGMD